MWRPSALQVRGAVAARAGGIDVDAAVRASAHVDVPLSADAVWEVLTDVGSWPRFLPGVSRARISDPGGPGAGLGLSSRFERVNGGLPVRSRVEVADTGRELTWTGVSLWLVAVHRNTLEPLAGGGCRVVSSESMAGLGAAWVMPPRRLRAALEGFVRAIGDEAQRRCS